MARGIGVEQEEVAAQQKPAGDCGRRQQSNDLPAIQGPVCPPLDERGQRQDGGGSLDGGPLRAQIFAAAALGHEHAEEREQRETAEQHETAQIAIGRDMAGGPEHEAPKDRMTGDGGDGALTASGAETDRCRIGADEADNEQEERQQRDEGIQTR